MRRHAATQNRQRKEFQSTHSAGNATASFVIRLILFFDFNPRIPQGMRLSMAIISHAKPQFQSTHSAGNATRLSSAVFCAGCSISIHAFRRECDAHSSRISDGVGDFNPRIPQGMRRRACVVHDVWKISIHAFRRECDGH